MFTDILSIIVSLFSGGALVKLAEIAYKFYVKRMEMQKPFTRLYPKIHQVYNTINNLLIETEAHRILIAKTTNGGGVPQIGSHLVSTIIYEAFDKPLKSIKSTWQNQEVDSSYVKVLYNMNKKGEIILRLDEMEDGMLKVLYNNQGIQMSHIIRIQEQKNAYIYMVMNFTERTEHSLKSLEATRVAVTKLKNLFIDERL